MDRLTKNNLFVALCASSLAFQTFILYGSPVDYFVIYAVFFSTMFIYSFHRLEKIRTDKVKPGPNVRHEQQNSLKKWTIFSLILLLPLVFVFSLESLVFFLILGFLTVWYSFGLKSKRWIRPLRNVPYLKLFWIGTMWTIMTVVVPLRDEGYSTPYGFLILERFLFILAITIPFDVRDVKTDAAEGLRTLPTILGISTSIRISISLLLLFTLLVSIGWHFNFHNRITSFPLFFSALISMYMIKNVREDTPDSYFSIGIEGLSLIQSVLIALSILFEY